MPIILRDDFDGSGTLEGHAALASQVTAIMLSRHPREAQPYSFPVLNSVGDRSTPEQLHAARLDAIARVTTPWCFFLDDDDALPTDHADVLQACIAAARARGVPMAYTDELVREDGQPDYRRCWYEYDSERHRTSPMGLHHLVLMDTAKAQAIAAKLPRGTFWTEHMLYWALGRSGAAYVPRVGYIWQRSAAGFSRNPRIVTAQLLARRWIEMALEKGAIA